jgi:hypothetical protein
MPQSRRGDAGHFPKFRTSRPVPLIEAREGLR